jgi:enhancing lycopene biosynthesis protein 2
MDETRNVLIESARIARGDIKDIKVISSDNIDALIIPGGFGAAKNLTKWAFQGPDGDILPDVKRIINEMVQSGKPVCGLCVGPTVIAKALEGSGIKASLTVGSTEAPSPYEIDAISAGMEKAGATAVMKDVTEISIDEENKIISAPCYMMEATISQIRHNIKMAVGKTIEIM